MHCERIYNVQGLPVLNFGDTFRATSCECVCVCVGGGGSTLKGKNLLLVKQILRFYSGSCLTYIAIALKMAKTP